MLEVRNEPRAAVGERVRVGVSARSVVSASARIYLLPVAGLLAGAGVAQIVATALISPAAGANAAGLGGIVGTVCAVLLGRRLANRGRAATPPLPRIVGVVVDSPPADSPCVDEADSRPVE